MAFTKIQLILWISLPPVLSPVGDISRVGKVKRHLVMSLFIQLNYFFLPITLDEPMIDLTERISPETAATPKETIESQATATQQPAVGK